MTIPKILSINTGAEGVVGKAAAEDFAAKSGGEETDRAGASEQRRRELADFLRTRREKLKPEQVGITQGARRRTPGLRREEVAELAGVGTTWYTWLEQARDIQPSAEVLRRLGSALQLNPAELRHMFSLAGKAAPMDIETTTEVVTDNMLRIVNEALQVPAILLGSRWDVLAINQKASDMFPAFVDLGSGRHNWLHYIFCNELTRTRLLDGWEMSARRTMAEFRASLAESLDNPWVVEIVDLLKADSPEFAKWWREHDVRENTPALIRMEDSEGKIRSWDRAILKPWENMRYKIIVERHATVTTSAF